MELTKIFAILCLLYAVMMFFSSFVKSRVMIKLVKMKFGKNISDKKAVNIMLITGVVMLIASIILFII